MSWSTIKLFVLVVTLMLVISIVVDKRRSMTRFVYISMPADGSAPPLPAPIKR